MVIIVIWEVLIRGEQIPPLEEEPQLRRTTSKRQPSIRYPISEYILILGEGEPERFEAV